MALYEGIHWQDATGEDPRRRVCLRECGMADFLGIVNQRRYGHRSEDVRDYGQVRAG